MGKLDIVQTEFLRDANHFADIWNGLAFGGRQVIDGSELKEISPVGLTVTSRGMAKKTADMMMARLKDGRTLGILITENQEKIDYGMIIRVHLREAMEYERQLKEKVKRNRVKVKNDSGEIRNGGEYMYGLKKEDRLHPVSTLILYWSDEKWDGATELHDILDFSGFEDIRELVTNFRMNLIDIGNITDEDKIFQNRDVRDVISLFLRRNDKKKFKEYVDEYGSEIGPDSMKMISVMVSSAELKEYTMDRLKEEREGDSMCKAITELISDGKMEGRQEGIQEGRQEGEDRLATLINKLLALGKNDDALKVTTDVEYREELYVKYGIKN